MALIDVRDADVPIEVDLDGRTAHFCSGCSQFNLRYHVHYPVRFQYLIDSNAVPCQTCVFSLERGFVYLNV